MNYKSRKRQRTKDRIACNFDVLINDSEICQALDISEGGIYVQTDHSYNPNSVVKISIHFRGEIMEIRTRVKHSQKGIGMGLMFIDLNNVSKVKIKEFIGSLEEKRVSP